MRTRQHVLQRTCGSAVDFAFCQMAVALRSTRIVLGLMLDGLQPFLRQYSSARPPPRGCLPPAHVIHLWQHLLGATGVSNPIN
jgi:hypothetical protein